MDVFTYETEFTSVIDPTKLFKAYVLDGDNLIPKVAPQAISRIEILEGDRGPGTIKKVTFGQDSSFNYVKHKVEAVDKDNLSYSYSLSEGDAFAGKLEKIANEVRFAASPNGGSIIRSIGTYYTIGDVRIEEEHVKEGKVKGSQLFKAIEAYLIEHPDNNN
ncbi:Bet v I type allergen [Parasponia andersonii]|uniref:Bet v I type allergen n=1 Tax=Parasponia andersonii TaxID=3476 RepID=A0A2P5CLT1_PARAD|nr:Bet v I type allergen [Parasponia andersonii]